MTIEERTATFYSLMKENHVIGAEKKTGLLIVKNGVEVYAYENDRGVTHIVEPGTGLSVQSDYISLEGAEFLLTPDIIEKIKTFQNWPEYPLRVEVFDQLKRAAEMWEIYEKKINAIIDERNKKEESKNQESEGE